MSFNDAMMAAIADAHPNQFDSIAKALWAAHSVGVVDDADAQRAAEAIQARRTQSPPAIRVGRGVRTVRRPRPDDAERRKRRERKRRMAAAGPMPPAMAAAFTQGELAVMLVVGGQARDHGVCSLHLDHIAALAGVSRSTARRALRVAARLGLVLVRERRRRGLPNLTNVVTVVSPEWRLWLAKGGGGRNRPSTNTVASKQESGSGFGARWQLYHRHYDPGDTSGDGRWRRRSR